MPLTVLPESTSAPLICVLHGSRMICYPLIRPSTALLMTLQQFLCHCKYSPYFLLWPERLSDTSWLLPTSVSAIIPLFQGFGHTCLLSLHKHTMLFPQAGPLYKLSTHPGHLHPCLSHFLILWISSQFGFHFFKETFPDHPKLSEYPPSPPEVSLYFYNLFIFYMVFYHNLQLHIDQLIHKLLSPYCSLGNEYAAINKNDWNEHSRKRRLTINK